MGKQKAVIKARREAIGSYWAYGLFLVLKEVKLNTCVKHNRTAWPLR
ncbi:hypothetical protein [Serratia symbiotica]|uniref:Uncharacterized protein n=1 Tax=Serratia symbiotica TaxID=138074 RepID=A0A455VKA7_9GAMM|nr:hypothetical protein [Serratia symbiotica]BBI91216.1 hypothetical protein SSYIS1_02960 [Serratia symbiotica]